MQKNIYLYTYIQNKRSLTSINYTEFSIFSINFLFKDSTLNNIDFQQLTFLYFKYLYQ